MQSLWVVACTIALCFALTVNVHAGDTLEGTLSAGSGPNKIKFTLTNKGPAKVVILGWDNPLEGKILSDWLVVKPKTDNKPLAYTGIEIHRSLDYVPEGDLVELAPSASKSMEVDLGEAYRATPGTFTIAPKFVLEEVTKVDKTAGVGGFKPIAGFVSVKVVKTHELTSPPFDITISNGPAAVAADAATPAAPRAKFVQVNMLKKHRRRRGGRRRVITHNQDCTTNVFKDKIVSALATSKPKLQASKTWADTVSCNTTVHWTKYFGAADFTRTTRVRAVLTEGLSNIDSFTADCSLTDCAPSVFAFVRAGTPTVHFCKVFNETSVEYQFGTILHEICHMPARDTGALKRATDIEGQRSYGLVNVLRIARDSPDSAVNNAENYEFFSHDDPHPNNC